MMYKKAISIFCVYALFITLGAAEQKKSFVIPAKAKKESTNTLKEHVGESVQKTLKQVTALQKQTAQLLEKLSETQEHLLKAGSSILKNKSAFKQASKESLAETENTLNALNTHLNEGSRMISIIMQQTEKNSIKDSKCFKLDKKKA